MARDKGVESLVQSSLGPIPGLTEKGMFGGWAFLLHGNLLCGVRQGSVMLRVGEANESWALGLEGVTPVVMRGRRMKGYVRAGAEAYGSDDVRQQLLNAAVVFTKTLKKKSR